jgi:hypothetical protein
MPDQVKDHIEGLLLFAGLATLLSALYRFGLPQAAIVRHHNRLTGFFAWASRGGWLDAMQSGVRLMLRLMTFIYGAPRTAGATGAREFLTVRAWKMSAWIAAALLFPVSLIAIAVIIVADAPPNGASDAWRQSGVVLALAAFSSLPFWLTFRRMQQDRGGAIGIRNPADLLLGGLRLSVVLGCPFLFAVLLIPLQNNAIAWELMDFVIFGLFSLALAGFVLCFVSVIKDHNFLAPVAMIAHILVSLFILGPTIFIVSVTVDHVTTGRPLPAAGALLTFAPAAVLACLLLGARARESRYRRPILFGIAALIIYVLCALVAQGMANGLELGYELRLVLSAPFLFVVPYVLVLYAAIYANSVPDWFSIALSRHILGQAATSRNIRDFLIWLLMDAVAVSLLVIATLFILIGVFLACAFMITVASRFGQAPNFEGVISYFRGGENAAPMLVDAVRSWSLRPPPPQAGAGQNGAFTILLLVLLSATSLIPTLVNALTVSVLLVGRALAMFLGPPLRGLHGLLVIQPDGPSDHRDIPLWRSSGIFGTIGAMLYILGYLIVRAIT